jgi:ribonuclease HII
MSEGVYMILGIDEAGRGAVIGPLVVAGVLISEKKIDKLSEIGVKDSKLLSKEQREELYEKILKLAKDYAVIKVPANEIDELRKRFSLNLIEAKKFAQIINVFRPKKVIVDCPQASTEKFKLILSSFINKKVDLVAENFADLRYTIVAAASILAKVERDREIEKLKEQINFDFGVGYPHDEKTRKFLKILAKQKEFPDFVRKSWITAIEMRNLQRQRKLEDF